MKVNFEDKRKYKDKEGTGSIGQPLNRITLNFTLNQSGAIGNELTRPNLIARATSPGINTLTIN